MRNYPKLSAKRARFIDEYLVDMNGAAAAVRAGFSARTSRAIACEILTKPDVLAALRARQAAVAVKLQIEREDVVRGLLAAVHMAREQANPMAMVAGLRETAKVLGFYAPEASSRSDRTAERTRLPGEFATMSDAQLTALLDEQGQIAT